VSLLIPIVLLGLLASLSPTTIVVFILLLATAHARVNAAAFLVGWALSLTVVFVIAYLLGGAHALRHGGGHTGFEIVEIAVGVGLLVAGARQWHKRGQPASTKGYVKKLTGDLDRIDPWEATLVGVVEQPWTLTAAAAIVLVRHHSAFIVAVLAFVLFTLISTATVGVTFLYYARWPGEAEARLAALRGRLASAGPAVLAGVCLVVGVLLAVDGVIGLLSN
jgi:hypothetical protein